MTSTTMNTNTNTNSNSSTSDGVTAVAGPGPVAASPGSVAAGPKPRALLAPSIGQQLIFTAGGRAFLGEIAGIFKLGLLLLCVLSNPLAPLC